MDGLWQDVSGKKIPDARAEYILNEILERDQSVSFDSHRSYFPWIKIAASLLLIVLFSGVLYYYWYPSFSENQQIAESSSAVVPNFIALPDGSTVVLNAGSALDYPMVFSGKAREVSLNGEAYFDIAHDNEHPFIVHTGKLTTTVLGTAFNIRAYADQSDIIVTVTRGKVKVSDDKKVLGIINPDQQITFNRSQEQTEQKVVDVQSVTSWMEKDIYFDDITIGHALVQLEKRFGISIRLSNENIRNCRFTATFVKGEDIGQILRILCDFNNATLVDAGDRRFIIDGGECPS
jgi:ferric-dicitrate binding protein FerR (iron transport regulator)